VRTVIDQLGYHASLVGQSLRSRKTNVIGVLVQDLEPFSAELLKGIGEGLRGTGYELVVFSGCGGLPDQAGWERRYLARVSGTLADGVILVTPGSVDAPAGSPVVAVDHNVRSSALPTVDAENFLGAVAAVEHLLALGHRRIGFVAGRRDLESARLREAAYRRALEQAGIAADPELVGEGGYDAESAGAATEALLALDRPPTAIFAASDVMALAAAATAAARGLTIPDDLSVVGFDNVPESALATPPLTTVEQPIRQMGIEAVRILMELFADPGRPPERVVLPTRLVVRRSTAPVSARRGI
jgi:LacI family transcriptional regulator